MYVLKCSHSTCSTNTLWPSTQRFIMSGFPLAVTISSKPTIKHTLDDKQKTFRSAIRPSLCNHPVQHSVGGPWLWRWPPRRQCATVHTMENMCTDLQRGEVSEHNSLFHQNAHTKKGCWDLPDTRQPMPWMGSGWVSNYLPDSRKTYRSRHWIFGTGMQHAKLWTSRWHLCWLN